jgi:hypothetical protein
MWNNPYVPLTLDSLSFVSLQLYYAVPTIRSEQNITNNHNSDRAQLLFT